MKYFGALIIALSLVACKPDPNLKADGEFVRAIEANDIAKVKEMVNNNKIPKDANIAGATPAVRARSLEMFKTLESLGLDMSWDKTEYTHILHQMLNGRNPDAPKELISEAVRLGHFVNFQDSLDAYTPAMLVIKLSNKNRLEKLKVLKESGADFSLKNKKGETLYQLVVDEEIKKYLESIGANK